MEKIRSLIESADSIVIMAHKGPDGDAIGSALALYNALLGMYKKVDVVIEDVPRIFEFLPNADKIKDKTDIEEYDLAIIVDCATFERVGQFENHYFENAKFTLNIDHHISNTKYANYNYVSEKSPACCEYLVDIFDELGIEITKDIATCLMVGLLTDTGGFQYANVGEKTYNFASRVCNLISIPKIYKKVMSTKTKAQFELGKIAMSRMELLEDDKIAYTYLKLRDFKKTNASYGDHEGIVNFGRNIEGVEVSIFVREVEGGLRVSLRGNGNVNVNKIALMFNGGGHRDSSGFDSELDLETLKEKLIKVVKDVVK